MSHQYQPKYPASQLDANKDNNLSPQDIPTTITESVYVSARGDLENLPNHNGYDCCWYLGGCE
jgi:hypothetical protein